MDGEGRGWGASWIGSVVDWGARIGKSRGWEAAPTEDPSILEKLRTSCYNVGRFCAK